jgi:hypothetical protein
MQEPHQQVLVIGELLRLALTFYVTIAIMGVGFATMIWGSDGAGKAVRVFFLRPVQFMLASIPIVLQTVLGSVWQGLAALMRMMMRAIKRELTELGKDALWLVRWLGR